MSTEKIKGFLIENISEDGELEPWSPFFLKLSTLCTAYCVNVDPEEPSENRIKAAPTFVGDAMSEAMFKSFVEKALKKNGQNGLKACRSRSLVRGSQGSCWSGQGRGGQVSCTLRDLEERELLAPPPPRHANVFWAPCGGGEGGKGHSKELG